MEEVKKLKETFERCGIDTSTSLVGDYIDRMESDADSPESLVVRFILERERDFSSEPLGEYSPDDLRRILCKVFRADLIDEWIGRFNGADNYRTTSPFAWALKIIQWDEKVSEEMYNRKMRESRKATYIQETTSELAKKYGDIRSIYVTDYNLSKFVLHVNTFKEWELTLTVGDGSGNDIRNYHARSLNWSEHSRGAHEGPTTSITVVREPPEAKEKQVNIAWKRPKGFKSREKPEEVLEPKESTLKSPRPSDSSTWKVDSDDEDEYSLKERH